MNFTVVQRFVITNILTVIYAILVTISIILRFLRFKLINFGKEKPKFVPPPSLTDPKYGVHKYVKANNVKLHYVESGDPSKPLMLFLHGFPEFWYTWRHQIVEFNKNYYCVALDMRGYGDSEKPEAISSYKLDILIEDVRDFIRKLGRNKCIIVSHDWGGIVASKFRDRHPEYVDGVMLFASITRESWHKEIWSNLNQHFRSWYTFFFLVPKLPELSMEMGDLEMFDTIFKHGDKNVDASTIECYKYTFSKSGSFTAPINYYRAIFSLTCPEKYIDNNVPMLVANAEKDKALVPNLLNRMKEEYKYIETILVKDTEHFLQEQEPEKVNKIIREFLTKHKL